MNENCEDALCYVLLVNHNLSSNLGNKYIQVFKDKVEAYKAFEIQKSGMKSGFKSLYDDPKAKIDIYEDTDATFGVNIDYNGDLYERSSLFGRINLLPFHDKWSYEITTLMYSY